MIYGVDKRRISGKLYMKVRIFPGESVGGMSNLYY